MPTMRSWVLSLDIWQMTIDIFVFIESIIITLKQLIYHSDISPSQTCISKNTLIDWLFIFLGDIIKYYGVNLHQYEVRIKTPLYISPQRLPFVVH